MSRFDIENLEPLKSLEELYLSHNGITKIEGLDALTTLTTLDLSANQIEHLEGLTALANLEELWVSGTYARALTHRAHVSPHARVAPATVCILHTSARTR